MFNKIRTYTTNFKQKENPISEGGNWVSGKALGADWADVVTLGGYATGIGGDEKFADPTALLAGEWKPDQEAQATVFSRNQTEKCNQEVEIRLRSSISAHSCTGYEILYRCLKNKNAYLEIVRWNGPLADFTYLVQLKGGKYGVENGDTIRAAIKGDVITAYKNNELIVSVKDNVFKAGNPGIGFNFGCGNTYPDFGLASFTAAEITS